MSQDKKSSIDELVLCAQKGDRDAYGLIYDQLVTPVYRYIYYRVEPQIAEDLTEETFLRGWEHIKKYKKNQFPFSAWIFRIAHNLVCDYYRQHSLPMAEVDENTADPNQTADPAFRVNIKLNQIRLRKALLKLPDPYQQVIILKYINELSNPEIAATLGKPEGTIRTIQFRALRQLRSFLSEKREDF